MSMSTMKKQSPNTIILSKSWMQLTDDPEEPYSDKWICDESWLQIMNDKFPNLVTTFITKRTHFVKTITMLAGPFNDSNKNRVYHKIFKVECPYEGKRHCVNFSIDKDLDRPPMI